MKIGQWLKINFLILGLVVVLFFMRRLRSEGDLGEKFNLFFGFPIQSKSDSQLQDEQKNRDSSKGTWNWCSTRVSEIQKGKQKIFQKGLKWYVKREEKIVEVDTIEVEKWFGQYCKVTALTVPFEGLNLNLFSNIVTISFVSGEKLPILRSDEGIFLSENKAFRSADLEEAINKLDFFSERNSQ